MQYIALGSDGLAAARIYQTDRWIRKFDGMEIGFARLQRLQSPSAQGVPAELDAHGEEPEGEGEAHGADGNAGCEAGADERAEDAADDEVGEQRGVESAAAQVHACRR